jgi:hypothetical protein
MGSPIFGRSGLYICHILVYLPIGGPPHVRSYDCLFIAFPYTLHTADPPPPRVCCHFKADSNKCISHTSSQCVPQQEDCSSIRFVPRAYLIREGRFTDCTRRAEAVFTCQLVRIFETKATRRGPIYLLKGAVRDVMTHAFYPAARHTSHSFQWHSAER